MEQEAPVTLASLRAQRLGYSALRLVTLSVIPEGNGGIPLDELQPLLAERVVRQQRLASYLPELAQSGLVELNETGTPPTVAIQDKGRAYVIHYSDHLQQARDMLIQIGHFKPAEYRSLSLIKRESKHPGGWLIRKGDTTSAADFISAELGVVVTTAENRLRDFARRNLINYNGKNAKMVLNGQDWLVATSEVFPEEVRKLEGDAQQELSEQEMYRKVVEMAQENDHMLVELYRRRLATHAKAPWAVDIDAERQELIRSKVDPTEFDGLSAKELKVIINGLGTEMENLSRKIDQASGRWR